MPPVADKNYFELFGLPVAFDLDIASLTSRYRELAREAHPDRFASGSDAERRLAMQMTTLINEAYRVLKRPILRAGYLVELKGPRIPQGAALDPEFLIQQMEMRERLEDARGNHVELDALTKDVQQLFQQREKLLARQLSPESWQPEQALRTVQEMQFLDKLRQQIADLEEESNR